MQRQRRWLLVGIMSFCMLFASAASADLQQAGELDPSFGAAGTGKVVSNFSAADERLYDVVLQPDGRIVAVGFVDEQAVEQFLVARYLADGTLDPTFGTGGSVVTQFGDVAAQAEAVALTADGRIVAVGWSVGDPDVIAVARYLADGTLDTSFGGDGMVTTTFGNDNAEAVALAIQADGKIIVAGSVIVGSIRQVAVVRYLPDGSLDSSFSDDGRQTTPFGSGPSSASSLVIQPDGKIVVAGRTAPNSQDPDLLLIRYNSDGSLDSSFNFDGIVTTDVNGRSDTANAVALAADGGIIVAGSVTIDSNGLFFAAKYGSDGLPDANFGANGLVVAPATVHSTALALALQSDGSVLVAGCRFSAGSKFALARFSAQGELDATFGLDGVVVTDFGSDSACIDGLALTADQRAVAVGRSLSGSTSRDSALARYFADVSAPPQTNFTSFIPTLRR